MAVQDLETVVHSTCPKYCSFLICNVIGTEIEVECLETVMALRCCHDSTCDQWPHLTGQSVLQKLWSILDGKFSWISTGLGERY